VVHRRKLGGDDPDMPVLSQNRCAG
jgi:hypothetical protein